MTRCSICSSGNEPAITAALCRGASYRRLAKLYKVGVASVGRHARSHIPDATRDRSAARALGATVATLSELKTQESANLLTHLVEARARLFDITDRAREAKNLVAEVSAEKQVLAALTVTAKLLGELAGHATTVNQNLVISPDYFRLRASLMQALSPPECRAARLAVSAALRQIESAPLEPEPQLAIGGPTSA